jgi:hypothetical protein
MAIFNREEGLYISGRIAFLVSRPLFLLIANRFFGNDVAAALAVAYLVSAVLMTGTAVDSHRIYYARFFGGTNQPAGFGFSRYIFAHLLLTALGILLCFFYAMRSETGWPFGVALSLFFITEKLADEVLRFTIFDDKRAKWGGLMLKRLVPQYLLFGCVTTFVSDTSQAALLLVISLALGNGIAFAGCIPSGQISRLFANWSMIRAQVRSAIRLIASSWNIWLLSLATTAGSYIDRIIVLLSDTNILAIFTILVSIFAIIQTCVEYFYLSYNRRNILSGKIKFIEAVFSKRFLVTISLSLCISFIASSVALRLYGDNATVNPFVFITISTIQLCLATTMISREIVYWNNQIKEALSVEVKYLMLLSMMFGGLYALGAGYLSFMAAAALALFVRMMMFASINPNRAEIVFR